MIAILKLWTAMMIFLTVCAGDTMIQNECSSEEIVSLSLGVRTNETGHLNLNGRLEQTQGKETWHVDVEYGRSTCSTRQSQTKILTFNVTGGYVKSPSPRKKLPLGYTLFESGYFRASKDALTWQAAKEACERDGAYLVTADSQAEADLLATQLHFRVPGAGLTGYFWYGASDLAQEGKFVTVAGTLLNETGYGTFESDEPSGGRDQNCVMVDVNTRQLEDWPCDTLLAYICKVPL